MEKRERDGGRWGALGAACLALAVALGLAATTAYLEAARHGQWDALRRRLEALERDYQVLNNVTSGLISQILALKRAEEEKASTYYDDDADYYDDDSYDDDYVEEEKSRPRNRTRRSLPGNKYNMIISQGPKRPPPHRKPAEVGAVVVIDMKKKEEELRQPGPYVRPYSPFERRSRVKATEDYRSHRPTTPPTYQEHKYTEERVRANRHRGRSRARLEDVEVLEDPGCSPVAVQFGGDTSKYRHSHHAHFDGNHRMYHPEGRFKDWSPSSWVMDMNPHFTLEKGELTVTTPGLYYLYAQVFYADVHDTSGYKVEVNSVATMQCTTTALSTSSRLKRNSCYTGGLVNLQAGDRVTVRELEGHRYTIFEPTKSYFGLFRVGRHSP